MAKAKQARGVRSRKQTKTSSVADTFREPREVRRDAAGVKVAVDGDDQGTRERHAKGATFDDKLQFVVGAVSSHHEVIDGRVTRVMKSRDALDLMLANGTITDDEQAAGRVFEALFILSNKSDLGAVDLSRVPGGMTKESFLDMKLNARQKLDQLVDLLGGPQSAGSLAMTGIVGYGFTLNQMVMNYSHGAHVWRGALIAALQVLSKHFARKAVRGFSV